MLTILVTEDDKNIRKLLLTLLKQNGYETRQAFDGLETLKILMEETIDLLILDLMMPNLDGYETLKKIRVNNPDLPVIIVTAKNQSIDRRKGFLLGTDDYLAKPIDEQEFILRVKALLRRTKKESAISLKIGETTVNSNNLSIQKNKNYFELPNKEFQLLFILLSYPNKIFTRQQLLDRIWGIDCLANERTIDVHIKRIREKIKHNFDFSIVTVRGLGYKAVNDAKK